MAKSGDVQDERYDAVPGMARSGDVQDERYDAVPGMARSGDVQEERSGFLLPANPKYLRPCKQ